MTSQATEQLVLQRIRNRVIELLEAYSDDSEPEMAQSLLEHWADWVDSKTPSDFVSPVFTLEEREAIAKTHQAWENIENSTSFTSQQWMAFVKQSHANLNTMLRRGKQSEVFEEQF